MGSSTSDRPPGHEDQQPAGLAPSPVTDERILRWLKDENYSYFLYSDGQIGGFWGLSTLAFVTSEEKSRLLVTGSWYRQANIEHLPDILKTCNRWNIEHIFPKAYTRVRDDGSVHIRGQFIINTEHGLTSNQLSVHLERSVDSICQFFSYLDNQYPDPLQAARS